MRWRKPNCLTTAKRKATRNVISSPLAGLDPAAVLDVRPIAKSLEQRLATDASLPTLPHKFGFAVDDGGLLGLAAIPADVLFVAFKRSMVRPLRSISTAPH